MHPSISGAALKHARNACFCDLYVFLRVFGHLAKEGSSREGGRGEGKPSPLVSRGSKTTTFGSTDFGGQVGAKLEPSWAI